jgi:RNA polymerase sigma-70 factor, ECF subfamily
VTVAAPAPPLPARPLPGIESRRLTEETNLAVDQLDELLLLGALRDGDEAALVELVRRYGGALRRLARSLGASEALAEEIVQETWLAALEGLDRFEERSSLKSWIFGILKNQARRRAARERRSVPFSELAAVESDDPVVDPARFQGRDAFWLDHWATPPRPWEDPERRLASLEARRLLRSAIGALPGRQRAVVELRDVEGLSSEEVCDLLDLSEGNQRVLLHRGRAGVRSALEGYMDG